MGKGREFREASAALSEERVTARRWWFGISPPGKGQKYMSQYSRWMNEEDWREKRKSKKGQKDKKKDLNTKRTYKRE